MWRVRWRDARGRNRSKVIGRKRDAEAFDADLRRRRRLGELDLLEGGSQTLADFAEEWWQLYAAPNLAPKTLKNYAYVWDGHVLPRLGGFRLRELNAEVLERFRADLHGAGAGEPTILKALMLLQGILQHAVAWRRIAANPVKAVRKPRSRRLRAVRPLAPIVVERMRAHFIGRLTSRSHLNRGDYNHTRNQRDATLVSLLAYAGLRPQEALALSWGAVRERTILIERAASMGEIRSTKGSGRTRTVRLLGPLAQDLAEWRLVCGRPDEDKLVLPDPGGEVWRGGQWQGWTTRNFSAAKAAAGAPDARPYDLRHSFVSLLIHEGLSIVEVARQAGHNPTLTLDTYAHVFDEFDAAERVPAEAAIRQARDELVPVSYRRA